MQITGKFKVDETKLTSKLGLLKPFGPVQTFIDNECIRLMSPYTPFDTGVLDNSIRINSTIGSGKLVQATPYARYLYYGNLMVDPETLKGAFTDGMGRFWSRPGVSKIMDPEGKQLKYDISKHPHAGPMWFERMKESHKDDILKGCQEIVRRG